VDIVCLRFGAVRRSDSYFGKCGIRKTDSTVASAIRTIVVLAFSWLMVFIVGSQDTIGDISGKTLLFLVLSGLATGGSWLCYYKALGKLGTGKAMPLNITYAAWSLPFSYLLLHQVPGTKDILCALVVLLGALLAAYEKPQKLEKSNNQ